MEVFVQKNYIKISLGISVLLFLICSKVLFKTKKSNLPHPPRRAALFHSSPAPFPAHFPYYPQNQLSTNAPTQLSHSPPTQFPARSPYPPLRNFSAAFPFSQQSTKKSDLPYFHRRAGSYSQADRTAKVRQIRLLSFT